MQARSHQTGDTNDQVVPREHFDYCRKARRLRARCGHKRRTLHEQLSRLKVCDEPTSERITVTRRVPTGPVEAEILAGAHRASPARVECPDESWPGRNVDDHGFTSGDERAVDHPAARDTFAELVSQRATGPVLTYEDRRSLLQEAAGRRIGRFEANLIIASVLHRATTHPRGLETPARRRMFGTVTAVAVIQALIMAGAYCLLRS